MKKVIIIGAGLSGLAAGIALASAGVHAEIYDLAPSAGGMCRAWYRKGYRFDSCIQWMAGTKKDDPAYALYREVGALNDDTIIYYPRSTALEIDGVLYDIPLEISAFRRFLTGLSKPDVTDVDALCADIEAVISEKSIQYSGFCFVNALDRLRRGRGTQWRNTAGKTVLEYAAGFKSETIQKILTRLAPEKYSAYTLLKMLAARMSGNSGYPLGGADGVITRMTQKFEDLGGKLIFGVKADEVIIAENKAAGIRAGGITYTADGVIAACGVPYVLDQLLGRRFEHQQLSHLLHSVPLYEPLAAVSFGLCRRFDIPYALTCECPEGLNVAQGVRRHGFALRSFDFDPTSAPDGCSSVMAMFEAPLDYWKNLREESPESYRLQKELLADHVASKIEKRYPGFRDAVEIVDVATPATFTRLTNACRGSLEGFAPTPEIVKTSIRKTISGFGRFCLCGQWTSPGGGIAAAIAGGREAAQIMRKEIRRPSFTKPAAVLPEKEWTSPA